VPYLLNKNARAPALTSASVIAQPTHNDTNAV
jgi:hypothetical protein